MYQAALIDMYQPRRLHQSSAAHAAPPGRRERGRHRRGRLTDCDRGDEAGRSVSFDGAVICCDGEHQERVQGGLGAAQETLQRDGPDHAARDKDASGQREKCAVKVGEKSLIDARKISSLSNMMGVFEDAQYIYKMQLAPKRWRSRSSGSCWTRCRTCTRWASCTATSASASCWACLRQARS